MPLRLLALFLCLCTGCAATPAPTDPPAIRPAEANTFSIVAYDAEAGQWGVGVASKYLAVGGVVPWAKAGVGAVATQAMVNAEYGPKGLALLAEGKKPAEALAALQAEDPGHALRQVAIIDAGGKAAAYSGDGCRPWAGHKLGEHYSCQGNLLAGEAVLSEMSRAFEAADGPLPWRIQSALEAADQAGGDRRGKQSAAILVVGEGLGPNGLGDRYVDLRVDDHTDPLTELARLLTLKLGARERR